MSPDADGVMVEIGAKDHHGLRWHGHADTRARAKTGRPRWSGKRWNPVKPGVPIPQRGLALGLGNLRSGELSDLHYGRSPSLIGVREMLQ